MGQSSEGQNNNRTHEPSLRELTAELDGVKELLIEKVEGLEKLLRESDRRYEANFEAMDEKTSLALASSKEAVNKAETATERRFESVNEFRKTLSEQANTFLPRLEYQSVHNGLVDKVDVMRESLGKEIQSLRESRSEGGGRQHALFEQQRQQNWSTGLIVASLLSGGAMIISLLSFLWHIFVGK